MKQETYIHQLIDAFENLDFENISFIEYEFDPETDPAYICHHYIPVLSGYEGRAPYNTFEFLCEHFSLRDRDIRKNDWTYSFVWVICGNMLIMIDWDNIPYREFPLANQISGFQFEEALIGNEEHYDEPDVFSESRENSYYPIFYNSRELRRLLLGAPLWKVIAQAPYGDNDIILLLAKYHFPMLQAKVQNRVLDAIKGKFIEAQTKFLRASVFNISNKEQSSIFEQDWLHHTLLIFQLHKGVFASDDEKRVFNHVVQYCKSKIKDIKPSKNLDTPIPLNCDISSEVLHNVYDWLISHNHLDIPEDERSHSYFHLYYLVTGRIPNVDGAKLVDTHKRFPWNGTKADKYVFVTFIKELYSFGDKGSNVEWDVVASCFDTDCFEEPLGRNFAHAVLKDNAYIDRGTTRSSGKHRDLFDLHAAFKK